MNVKRIINDVVNNTDKIMLIKEGNNIILTQSFFVEKGCEERPPFSLHVSYPTNERERIGFIVTYRHKKMTDWLIPIIQNMLLFLSENEKLLPLIKSIE